MVKICTKCEAKNEFDARFWSSCDGMFEKEEKPTFTPVIKTKVLDETTSTVEEPSGHFKIARAQR